MSNFIQDVFKTRQPDGSYVFDMTNPGWSVCVWLLGVIAYVAVGVYQGIHAAGPFDLVGFATGLGASLAGGGVGVFAHSKANV